MLYDTHCHIYTSEYGEQTSSILSSSQDLGILLNIIGTNLQTSKEALSVVNDLSTAYAVVGIHPSDVYELAEKAFDDLLEIEKLATSLKVAGIGECGLDYYRLPEGVTKEELFLIQKPIFLAQIAMANRLHKALVIHCRPSKDSVDAYEDLLKFLIEYKPERFEIHSYTGNVELSQKFLALGAYIAFNGILTFDRSGEIAQVLRNCPSDRILIETDAPYLAPVPFRGKQNIPEYVKYIAQHIGTVLGKTPDDIAALTTANAKRLFQITD